MRCKVKSDTCQSKRTGKKEEVCVSSDKKRLIHLGVLWLFSQRGPPRGREVKNHRVESLKPGYHRIPNRCIDRRQYQLHHVCPKERCYRQCSTCSHCNEFCMKFREERCLKLQLAPYMCNGCKEENLCTLRKQFYVHDAEDILRWTAAVRYIPGHVSHEQFCQKKSQQCAFYHSVRNNLRKEDTKENRSRVNLSGRHHSDIWSELEKVTSQK